MKWDEGVYIPGERTGSLPLWCRARGHGRSRWSPVYDATYRIGCERCKP